MICTDVRLSLSIVEYRAWSSMKTRCYNRNSPNYRYYGGRGISVCDRWLNSFQTFLRDVGNRPGPGYSLDRYPNNDGNYEPGNVRWATKREQQNNTRSTRLVTFNGKTQSLSRWADEIGISFASLKQRIKLHGIEVALSHPAMIAKRYINNAPGRACRRTAKSSSGFKGVYKQGNGYESVIKCSGVKYYLGYFHCPEEAAKAYNDKARELFGERARLNQF